MEILTERELENRFGALPWAEPRAVVSGNFATPRRLVELFDAAVESYRLFALNAQKGSPVRQGVIPESPFVGPGMRDVPGLDYLPMRLSLVPRLFDVARPPDVVLLHTSAVHDGKVSLGTEVNILPAAIERARVRGGLVVAQINPHMPYTYGDGELDVDAIDVAIDVEEELPSVVRRTVSEVTSAIGVGVATLVEDGATI
ncbi:MAG: 4-hydroxybutyrate CoA-transferase, partial [Acidimicrobiales bacterium]|nr:4-hydroxybutyrate CoA-transferase [Acidimicrobiales bacterium]